MDHDVQWDPDMDDDYEDIEPGRDDQDWEDEAAGIIFHPGPYGDDDI